MTREDIEYWEQKYSIDNDEDTTFRRKREDDDENQGARRHKDRRDRDESRRD
jgi:hypothetical protein